MNVTDTPSPSIREIFTKAVNGGKSAASDKQSTSDASESVPRTHQDTVTLSQGGQDIVNLGRGLDLAKEIRSAPVDENFAEKLEAATKDVFRISNLFAEVIKTAFGRGRS